MVLENTSMLTNDFLSKVHESSQQSQLKTLNFQTLNQPLVASRRYQLEKELVFLGILRDLDESLPTLTDRTNQKVITLKRKESLLGS